jgi:two-component system, OmpR family, response regulator PrrA
MTRATLLRSSGFLVHQARDTSSALRLVGHSGCAVALVDRGIAGHDCALCLSLRQLRPSLGIVLLAPRWEPSESRWALCTFADDCISDDIDVEDLVARIRSVYRRSALSSGDPCSLCWGPLRIDFVGGYVEIDGRELPLQPLQLRILAHLVRRAGNVVTREEFRRLIFRAAHAAGSTNVARQISILRKQLGSHRGLVATVDGGYRLVEL